MTEVKPIFSEGLTLSLILLFFQRQKAWKLTKTLMLDQRKTWFNLDILKVQPCFWQRLNHGNPTDDFKSKAFLRTYEQPCNDIANFQNFEIVAIETHIKYLHNSHFRAQCTVVRG